MELSKPSSKKSLKFQGIKTMKNLCFLKRKLFLYFRKQNPRKNSLDISIKFCFDSGKVYSEP